MANDFPIGYKIELGSGFYDVIEDPPGFGCRACEGNPLRVGMLCFLLRCAADGRKDRQFVRWRKVSDNTE